MLSATAAGTLQPRTGSSAALLAGPCSVATAAAVGAGPPQALAALHHAGKQVLLWWPPEIMLSRAAIVEAGALHVPAWLTDRTCNFVEKPFASTSRRRKGAGCSSCSGSSLAVCPTLRDPAQ